MKINNQKFKRENMNIKTSIKNKYSNLYVFQLKVIDTILQNCGNIKLDEKYFNGMDKQIKDRQLRFFFRKYFIA